MESVYRDYLTDLAPSASGIFPMLREVGHREPDQLARWFADSNAHAVTILYGDERVGFALVSHRLREAARSAVAPAALCPRTLSLAAWSIKFSA